MRRVDHLVVLGRGAVRQVEHLPDAIEEADRLGAVLFRLEAGRFMPVLVTLVVIVVGVVVMLMRVVDQLEGLGMVVVVVVVAHRRSVAAQRARSGARSAASCSRCGEPRYSLRASGSRRCSSTTPLTRR